LLPPGQRGPSVEDLIVAETQAGTDAEAMCLMPDAASSADQQHQIAIPTGGDLAGDIAPLRMVVDPYPSFNGVAVDTVNDLVMMSDTNRKSLLVYDRTAGGGASRLAASPRQQIMGPATGIGFIAGVAMDPEHRELFTVNK